MSTISVIIVTHNSQPFIDKAVTCLQQQTRLPNQVIIIDSGSSDTSYLNSYRSLSNYSIILEKGDVGFCRGNNIAFAQLLPTIQYVLFLNPDAFLFPDFLEKAVAIMEENPQTGCLTSPLLGYDIKNDRPTGRYDSTGIFRTWYGRWHDRAQGRLCSEALYRHREEVPAICGALMFCRHTALQQILIKHTQIFDESFYMYKDDIDLSMRLRQAGWKLLFDPTLRAFHCRGWNRDRSSIDKMWRLMSSRNDIRLDLKQHSPYLVCSIVKYLAVRFLDI
jgi:GT2 family glycosyltransferase